MAEIKAHVLDNNSSPVHDEHVLEIGDKIEHAEEKEDVGSRYPDNYSQTPMAGLLSWLAIAGLVLGYIASQEIITLPAALAAAINANVGPRPYYYWLNLTGLFGGTTGWAIAGPLSDQYGRKRVIIIGHIIALIGAVISLIGKQVYVVMIGLTIAGLGSGGQAQAIPVLLETVRNRNRGWVLALVLLSSFPFNALNPNIVNSMAQNGISWRWGPGIHLIITPLALVLVVLFFHPPPRETSAYPNIWKRPISIKHVDWVNMLMIIFAFSGVGLCVTWAGFGVHKWATPAILVPLIVGLSFLVQMGLWTHFFAKNAMFPPIMFQNFRGFTVLIAISCLAAYTFMPMFQMFPQEIAAVYTPDATKISRYQLATGLGSQLGILVAGCVIRPLGHTNILLGGSVTLATIFIGLMAALTPNGLAPSLAYMTLGSFASGCFKTIITVSITYAVPDILIGSAFAVLNFATQFGPAFGLGFYSTIISSRVRATLVKNIAKAALPLGLPMASLPALIQGLAAGDIKALMSIEGINPQIFGASVLALKQTYSSAFQIVWLVAMAAGILAIPLSFFAINVRPSMDDHRAVPTLAGNSLLQRKLSKKNDTSQ